MIEDVEACDCLFSGALALDKLPTSVEIVVLTKTSFRELLISNLDLNENSLSGSINLSVLPESINSVNLSRNGFSGSFCLSSLPPNMQSLLLAQNKLSGDLVILEEIDVSGNDFANNAIVYNRGVSIRVDECINVFDSKGNPISLFIQEIESGDDFLC